MKHLRTNENLKLSYKDVAHCLEAKSEAANKKFNYDSSDNVVFGGGKIEVIDERGIISFSSKKVSYDEINKQLQSIYYNDNEYFSSAMDILASYVKGQKLIYMEAENFCQQKLNYLMFPSIFSSATASVMATSFENYEWGGEFNIWY